MGPKYVCRSIWNELGFNDVLMANGISEHVLPLLETLVVGRLASPGSERHAWQWAQDRSAIYELTGSPLRPSLNVLYAPETACLIARNPSCRTGELFLPTAYKLTWLE